MIARCWPCPDSQCFHAYYRNFGRGTGCFQRGGGTAGFQPDHAQASREWLFFDECSEAASCGCDLGRAFVCEKILTYSIFRCFDVFLFLNVRFGVLGVAKPTSSHIEKLWDCKGLAFTMPQVRNYLWRQGGGVRPNFFPQRSGGGVAEFCGEV